MSGTKELGSVGIRARPVTEGFRAELKNELRKIEKSTVVELDVELDEKDLRADAKKKAKKASGEKVKFEATVEDRAALRELAKFKRELDKISATQDDIVELSINSKTFKKDLTALKKQVDGIRAEIKPVLKKVDLKSFDTILVSLEVELDAQSVREVTAEVQRLVKHLGAEPIEFDVQLEKNALKRAQLEIEQVFQPGTRELGVHFEPDTNDLEEYLATMDQETQIAVGVSRSSLEEVRAQIDSLVRELNSLSEVEFEAGVDRTSLLRTAAEIQSVLAVVQAQIGVRVDEASLATAIAGLQVVTDMAEANVDLGIDVDTAGAVAKLESVMETMSAVSDVEVDVDLDEGKSVAKMTALREKLRLIAKNAGVRIMAELESSRALFEFERAVYEMKAYAKAKTIELLVKLNRTKAMNDLRNQITEIRAKVALVSELTKFTIGVKVEKFGAQLAELRAKTLTAAKSMIMRIPVVANHKETLAKVVGAVKLTRLRIPLLIAAGAAVSTALAAVKGIKKVVGKVTVPLAIATRSVAKATATALGWAARLQAAFLVNPLTKWIVVKVSKASLAYALTTLEALSGFSTFKDITSGMGKMVTNFDKLAVSVGAVSLALAGFANVGIGAIGSLSTILGDVVKAAGVLWAAPAFLAAAAIQGVVLGSALKDIKTRLSDLTPAFSNLQSIMSNTFWASAEQPIRNLINTHLPALESGFANVAEAMGESWGSFASTLEQSLKGRLTPMFDALTEGINNSREGTDAWADSIAILGSVGSKYLPKFGTWFSDISVQFNNFLAAAEADGRLEKWIDEGIRSLKALGKSILEVGRIGGVMYQIFDEAGFAGLEDLANGLENVRKVMESPEFKAGALDVLGGAHKGIKLMNDGLGDAFTSLGSLSSEIGVVLEMAGGAIGTLGSMIGDVFTSDKFGTGLIDLFSGIRTGMEGLAPMAEDLGNMLGLFASSAGEFLGTLGTELGDFADVGLILNSVLAELGPVASSLTSGLAGAIRELLPPFAEFVDAILPTLSSLLQSVGPLFESIGAVVGGILVPVFGILSSVLQPLLSLLDQAANGLTPIFNALASSFDGLGELFAGNAESVADGIVQMIQGIGDAFPDIVSVFVDLVTGIVDGIAAAVPDIAAAIGQIWPVINDELLAALPTLLDAGTTILTSLITGITESLPALAGLATELVVGLVEAIATNLPSIVESGIAMLNALLTGIVNALPVLLEAGLSIITGIVAGITENLPAIIEGAIALITGFIEAITTNLPLIIEGAIQLVTGLLTGIVEALPLLLDGAVQIITGLVTALIENLPLIIEAAIQIVTSLITGIVEALPLILEAGLNLIEALANALIDNLPTIIAGAVSIVVALVQGLIGALPKLLVAAVQLIVALAAGLIENLPTLIVKTVEIMFALGQGLIAAIPQLLKALPEIFNALAEDFTSFDWAGMLVDAGQDLINGLIGGITSMGQAAWEAVMGIGNSLIDGFKGLFGIASPSKVMKKLGIFVGQGTVIGLEHERKNAEKAMLNLVSVPDVPTIPVKANLSEINGASNGNNRNGFVQTNNIVMPRTDPSLVAGEVGAAVSRQRAMAGI